MSPFLQRLKYRAIGHALVETAMSAGIIERHHLVLRARALYLASEQPEFKPLLDKLWASQQYRALELILSDLGVDSAQRGTTPAGGAAGRTALPAE